ncbi:MAG: MinD/ParA family protein [Firmicutes bacterium]|nr:MinD/ParA family protein [Bacillota bacterium]MCL5039506.1 MinD/ParA family protein [Bacillota bacterium]
MKDQAEELRNLVRTAQEARPQRRSRVTTTRVLAVTSGKGGVGKTNITANLALALARLGKGVIIFDADVGLANSDVILGMNLTYDLSHLVRGEREIDEILSEGPLGVKLVGGGSGLEDLVGLGEREINLLVEKMGRLDGLTDIMLVDTGAGLSRPVVAFLTSVSEVLVVATPEPTSLLDAYATMKLVSQKNPAAALYLVINRARSAEEASFSAGRLALLGQRFLGREITRLGHLPDDEHVQRAVRAQTPFLLAYPSAPASRAVLQLAARLTAAEKEEAATAGVRGFLARLGRFLAT